MMKPVILGAAFVALLTTGAFADQFAGFYGNTVTITREDGTVIKVYVNPDKTWEQRTADGKVMRGTFEWADDTHVCFTVTDPKPEKPEACKPRPITGDHKPGDTWTDTDDEGHKSTITVTAGRS